MAVDAKAAEREAQTEKTLVMVHIALAVVAIIVVLTMERATDPPGWMIWSHLVPLLLVGLFGTAVMYLIDAGHYHPIFGSISMGLDFLVVGVSGLRDTKLKINKYN